MLLAKTVMQATEIRRESHRQGKHVGPNQETGTSTRVLALTESVGRYSFLGPGP